MRAHDDAGFTLIELLVVVALVTLVAGAAGTFFLGGTTLAVSSAARDIGAALDEGRRTAIAFDAATVVFAPVAGANGYRARVFRGLPGDAAFAPQNGPSYDSTIALSETVAPLGAPAFGFGIDSHGAITGYAHLAADGTGARAVPCPASGAFSVHLAYVRDVRDIAIPCALAASSATPPALATPAPAASIVAASAATCPPNRRCVLPQLAPPIAAACPPGMTQDPASAGVCDGAVDPVSAPAPSAPATSTPAPSVPSAGPQATPTPCPAAFSGTAPACAGQIVEQYVANADGSAAHTSSLFANGSICDDDGCSLFGGIDWTWGCAYAARSQTNGYDGANAVALADTAYQGSVASMVRAAEHDAAQNSGSGLVTTADSFCTGAAVPNP